MRLNILFFVSAALAMKIPRCKLTTTSSIPSETATSATSTTIARAVGAVPFPTTKPLITVTYTTASVPPSAVEKSSCTPHSICADYRNDCGQRYGGCFDENYCDGNTSPFPIPACPTLSVDSRKRGLISEPMITAA